MKQKTTKINCIDSQLEMIESANSKSFYFQIIHVLRHLKCLSSCILDDYLEMHRCISLNSMWDLMWSRISFHSSSSFLISISHNFSTPRANATMPEFTFTTNIARLTFFVHIEIAVQCAVFEFSLWAVPSQAQVVSVWKWVYGGYVMCVCKKVFIFRDIIRKTSITKGLIFSLFGHVEMMMSINCMMPYCTLSLSLTLTLCLRYKITTEKKKNKELKKKVFRNFFSRMLCFVVFTHNIKKINAIRNK